MHLFGDPDNVQFFGCGIHVHVDSSVSWTFQLVEFLSCQIDLLDFTKQQIARNNVRFIYSQSKT